MGRRPAADTDLSRDVIINTALGILEKEGLAALSLGRIAEVLDVKTPALYWYFRSKNDLMTYVADAQFRRLAARIPDDLTGLELLWTFGREFRSNLVNNRDSAKLMTVAGVSREIRTDLIPRFLERIATDCMTPGEARKALTAIEALSLGWAIFEANPATSEVMERTNEGGDAAFEEALAKLVFGQPRPPA